MFGYPYKRNKGWTTVITYRSPDSGPFDNIVKMNTNLCSDGLHDEECADFQRSSLLRPIRRKEKDRYGDEHSAVYLYDGGRDVDVRV
jgi:hypothetical protein